MLKKAKTRKVGTRIMAWFMTLAMMMSLVGVMPEPIWAGQNALVLDGAEVTWDMRESGFGAYADTDGSYTTDDGILTITGAITLNGAQHGASVPGGTVFSINVPAGKVVITVGACQYGSASGTLKVGGTAVSETKALGGLSADTEEVVFEYTAAEATTVDLEISGSGFVHYIKAKAESADKELVTIPANKVLSWDLTSADAELYAGTNAAVAISGTFKHRGDAHGADVGTGTKIAINVPAGDTTIVVGACQYGSASAVLTAGGKTVVESQALGGAATDGADVEFTYSAKEATTVVLEISGGGYIHYIKVQTEVKAPSFTEKVFEVGNMDTVAKGGLTEGQLVENGDFTLVSHSNSAIEAKKVTFEDGYVSTNRLSLGGSLSKTKAAIKFTTANASEVVVYWMSGGDGREIKIINEAGDQAAITSVGSIKNTAYISTLSLEAGGTYYLGSSSSSNYIFKIVVKEEIPQAPTLTLDIGDMESKAKGDLAEGEEVVCGDFTLISHSNSAIEAKAQSFEDGYVSTKRLSLGGSLSKTKAAIKFTTVAEADVTVYWVSGGDGREIKVIDAEGNQAAITSVGSIKNTAYISTFTLDAAGTYYLGSSSSSNYIFKIVVAQKGGVKYPTVKDVTVAQDETDATGATVNVSFTGTAGDETANYSIEASKDGEKWIKLGKVAGNKTEGSLAVNLGTKDLGFGTWQFRVVGKNTVVATNSIVYAPKTYTLSGTYNTGLEDAGLLTGLKFTATTASIYTVPEVTINTTNHTYSVVLEQGTTYKVEGIGVDEYDMITPAGAITYHTDTTLNLEFNKKVFYKVTISLGSTPDLSGKELVYTFTHADGAVYEFEAGEDIQLRDGVYTVTIGGDFEQMAYTIKTGGTLTVAGAPVNHAITFTEKTSWSFAVVPNKIEGTTGWFHGIYVNATNGKLASNGDNCCAAVNSGTILKVPVLGPCTITVTPHAGQAQYALYTINGVAASTTESSTTVEYTGEAGTIDIVATGTAYISGIAVTYEAKDVEFEKQPVMPSVPETDTDAVTDTDTNNIPKGNNKDSLTIQPIGQKLTLSQAGGKYGEAFKDVSNLGYYLFPMTSDDNKLEFDVLITDSRDTSNAGGFLAGVFTNDHVYSLGLRGGIKVRGLYSKSATGFVGAGSPAEENIGLNRLVHYVITMADTRPTVTITFVDDDGVTQTRSWSQNPVAENGAVPAEYYFGFMLANVDATITNMIYTSGDGKTVYYDQNACYHPEGTAPVASNVTAVGSETREFIDISWTGTVPEYDGTYVVEVQKDGGEWVELTQDVTGFTYRYVLPAGDGGNYKFRVCGQLGKESLGGERNNYATMESTIYVKGALEKPVVELEEKDKQIVVTWQKINGAEYYVVYRYTSDQGPEGAVVVAERLTTNTFTDKDVKVDVPYYYYVKAVSETDENESPYSVTEWKVVASEREGEYAQEKEGTGIFITKKSYDTVFKNKVVIEGVVYGKGTLTAFVGTTQAAVKVLDARDTFALEIAVQPGRNDVNIFFKDEDGNTTRQTFNFVYLTNYDVVVDAAYTGTDGELVNGIPTYKTIQAAVDAAGATSTLAGEGDRTVILVMAGSYEERLEVKTPNITLIGEDRENTLIHFYPGVLGEKYEAGGDMDKRCATYIYESAKGFTAENISFANDYDYSTADGKSNKSADAIRVEADNSVFVNVGFESVQDTLYMHSGKQYYYKCEIKGLVDFIYSGEKAQSYFNDCEIIFVYEPTKNSGYVCAPKTDANATYGLTFNNCVITAEEGCTGASYLLARPWGANAYITWINCYMGEIINKYDPYGDMSGNMAEDARFFEYGTYGPGYLINSDRRQISPEMAEKMTSATYLGWDVATAMSNISSGSYVGSVETEREKYDAAEPVEYEYLFTDGDDTGLKMYDMEGYADVFGVTGGGLLLETNANYYKVDTAEEFLDAILAAKTGRQNTVIELTADINLGCYEIENFDSYSKVIKAYKNQALTHPTLIKSGVSQLNLEEISNLTIFSLNGASIKHANITMKKAENIIIRNIKFDELWEWDEDTHGDYDRNDWDYMTIDSGSDGIWIDHCTFYKAYDGIIDIKNPNPMSHITISWCEFLPGSEDDTFFNVMMDEIKANEDDYAYYKELKAGGMSEELVYKYAYFQKKTHLFGQDDTSVNAAGIRVTLANNYYLNSMDRLPRLRYGNAHVYNCVMDSKDILKARLSLGTSPLASKFVSNGAASTCGAQVLLENCFIRGIQDALNSGNGSSPAGYINAINSLYSMNGKYVDLVVKNKTSADDDILITDADAFIASLPYADYVLYDAKEVTGIVPYYAGAGKLDLTVLQWEKTSYNAEWKAPIVNETGDVMDTGIIFMITLLGAAFVTAGFFAKKKFAVEE